MGHGKYLIFIAYLASLLVNSDGCQMEDITNWLLPVSQQIYDIDRGVIFNRTTTNIDSVVLPINPGGGVDASRYLSVSLENSRFLIITTQDYEMYEEYETSESMSFSVTFGCSGGSTATLIFEILVRDTNNNAPIFRPSNEYEVTITPPLPPGFQITGCIGDDIIVRDIDLTTEKIDFDIQENPYFEMAYSGRSSTDPKEFIGLLRTKNLIRSLPEPVELTIYATDVDRTDGPPITTTATIRIQANDEFQFPDEPVFSQPFYLASYTSSNQLVIQETITLEQGYDAEVIFTLDGEHKDYFTLVANGNQISISVRNSLPTEILRTGQVILVVRAEREHTSGATAAVVIQLPEVLGLEFVQSQYESSIIDNQLEPIQLILKQGYEEQFGVDLVNEFASFFATNIQGNTITLSMNPLNSTILETNNFISLQVVASNQYSSATTVVTLDIIKDDKLTPVFENAFYAGSYDAETGLVIDEITLVQGYDETVTLSIQEDYKDYFQISNDGPVITMTSSGIPQEMWTEQQLLFYIEASKPRSVTATAVISIRLPSEIELAFEESVYSGSIQENTLTVPTIVLSSGFSDDVNFTLSGGYENYFEPSRTQNGVTINLSASLPEHVILENSFLTLVVGASGVHAVPTSTVVVLEIIKRDVTTPVFTENIYRGTYMGASTLEIGNISLAQGYDSTVTFGLDGEHAEYFRIATVDSGLSLELVIDIPPEVIFREKVLLFNVLANKPLTVGANAAVSIAFPQELTDATIMRFSQNTYVGSLYDNKLVLADVVLETGHENGTEFELKGEYSSYFSMQNVGNVVTILINDAISEEVIKENKFIILEVEARRERAVTTSAGVVIEIVEDEIEPPIFNKVFYRGVYANSELQFEEEISLVQGFDESVTFVLEGVYSAWFTISQNNGNLFTLSLNNNVAIPEEILENNNQLLFTIVAISPGTINGTATISIELPKEIPETVVLRFTRSSYVGRIDNGELYAPTITLLGDRNPIHFNLTGVFASYFEIIYEENNVKLNLSRELPEELIEGLAFTILDIEASYPEAIRGHTAVVLELTKQPQIITPVFEQAYYIGEYSLQSGLQLDQPIRLIQGFDESVMFTLTGDDAQWFELKFDEENYITLRLKDNTSSSLGQIRDRSHLVFSVLADKPESVSGRAAIIINLADSAITIPLTWEQTYYRGSIENNILTIANIKLLEGYSPEMNVSLTGEHDEYFQLVQQEEGIFTIQIISELPANVIEANNVLVFTLQVEIDGTKAHTTVILELIKTDRASFVFEEAYYVGSYSIISGFTFDPQITLKEHDPTVSFSLEGDNAQWFDFILDEDRISIIQEDPIPTEVLINNAQLIFVIVAERPNNVTTRSTIVIQIIDDTTILNFERNVYIGSIQGNEARIDTINVTNGYSDNVSFKLIGELQNYFNVTSVGGSVTMILQNPIPEEKIPENRILSLELQASAPQAITAYTTLLFGVVQEQLSFEATYYTGIYTITEGLEFPDPIVLSEGYDENVIFTLEGESAQYFTKVVTDNSLSLRILNPIPQAIVISNQQLIFTIRAEKPNAITTRGTIVISLKDDITEDLVLSFDQISYLGSIQNNIISLNPVMLSAGYSENVSFALYGELEQYFRYSSAEGAVTISLNSPIPEESLPNNGIIILELQARAPGAMSAYATIVLHVVRENIELLIFNQTYYTGHYTEANGLVFDKPITLSQGYDENVEFALEGESSQYFEPVVSGNSVTLRILTPIPSETVTNNHHLIFTVQGDKPGVPSVRTAVIISLLDVTSETQLKFEKIAYVGSIENGTSDLEPIRLVKGYDQSVSFELMGDLNEYFNLLKYTEEIVTVSLENQIPEELLPTNRLIILEVHASASDAIPAQAAIIFNVKEEDIETIDLLTFSENYYTGHYTELEGLTFKNTITLARGFSENVEFALEGENAQYFEAVVSGNSVTLRVLTPIPPAVITNNQQIIFALRAAKTGAITARTVIVISMLNDISENSILGFDRITYIGTLNNDTLNLNSLSIDGNTENVTFILHGDLYTYFNVEHSESTVRIKLLSAIPEESQPQNNIIVLEIQASAPEARSAYATIVIEIIQDDVPNLELLQFSEVYYTGQYTEKEGLLFEESFTLAEGYSDDVQFVLEGENSQYFEIVTVSRNLLSLRVITPIPSAVILNNQQLVFTIRAEKPGALTTRATIIISLLEEFTPDPVLGFDRISYIGRIVDNTVDISPIILSEGYSPYVVFSLFGDLERFFSISNVDETVSISLENAIPEELIPDNRLIILELQATATETMAAHTTIIFEVVLEDTTLDQLVFGATYYTGHFAEAEGLTFNETISLTEGYNENVHFLLEGDSSQYFDVVITSSNVVTLRIVSPIPPAVVSNNQQLIFIILAERPGALTAKATIVISLWDEFIPDPVLGFDRISYIGKIIDNTVDIRPIILSEGYSPNVVFSLFGDLERFFSISNVNETVSISLQNSIPQELIPDNRLIILALQATATETMAAHTTIIFEVVLEDTTLDQLVFGATYYTGHFAEAEGLTFNETISLTEGFNENVQFILEGDSSQYFGVVITAANAVTLRIVTPIPPAVVSNNQQLIFTIRAERPGGITTRATVIISLIDEHTEGVVLGFNRISYAGSVKNNAANIEPILLSEGFSDAVLFELHGQLREYFSIETEGPTVTLVLSNDIPEESIPENLIILLELQALAPETMSAYATIVLEVVQEVLDEMIFSEPYYIGQYTEEKLVFENQISLYQGFDDNVEFVLEGEKSQWFRLQSSGNSASLSLESPIPQDILENKTKIVLLVIAERPNSNAARAVIIISILNDAEECIPSDGVRFDKVLFRGNLEGEVVRHESINLFGYEGSAIQILGVHAPLFEATFENGLVNVRAVGSVTISQDETFVPLELRAGTVSAVLLLQVFHTEEPSLPSIAFSAPSYIVRVEISQIGFIGQVQATAENGETVTYALALDDAHLVQRISINNDGELRLSAPVNTGVYSFSVVATTLFSQATASAPVHLTVDAITICNEDDLVLPPLMTLNRDEESPHENLVVLDTTKFAGCLYQLTNRWPLDQTWLYVDENGLHSTAIDREDESIAFMALSQVQVELILQCDNDVSSRTKRSLSSASRLDHLGPYDYGDKNWILTDSILYNPRRSLVNLIVNDINDNAPIFNGKENEPIVVGYPIADLEERILPRALVEVKATDADVGVNAALVYWSPEEVLAVSPHSGLVHVRNNINFENNTILTVYATDNNGQGLNGSITIMVKLIDTNHIAVVTVKNSFLEDGPTILAELSSAVGYEVKALRSTVLSDAETDLGEQRKKRQAVISSGASLQLFVYGLIERDPVDVTQLAEDINNSDVTALVISNTLSLEDYLENLELCPLPGRDTGLLIATIVLSVLLFILIVAAAVWFFLRWRANRNYEQFSDENSIESPSEPSTLPKPIVESIPKPRINLEDLKRSERRLQEMLEAPVEEIIVQPTTAPKTPEPKQSIPEPRIVIQSIDKLKDFDGSDDEDVFGERARDKRKSVVTFNENVEKIIHVEDTPDDGPEYEVYKL